MCRIAKPSGGDLVMECKLVERDSSFHIEDDRRIRVIVVARSVSEPMEGLESRVSLGSQTA